jgi:hypothetical protein
MTPLCSTLMRVRRCGPGVAAVALTLALAALSGCARPIEQVANPLPVAAGAYARLFQTSISVLRDEGFVINRQDYRFGVVNTRPKPSPTAFEPWLGQNTTAYQAWESTFSYERRTVTVTLEPVGPETAAGNPVREPEAASRPSASATPPDTRPAELARPGYLLRVEVLMERQQNPTQQMTGSTAGGAVVADLSATPVDLTDRGIVGAFWRPLGRDPYLERQILAEIIRRATTPVTPSSDAVEPSRP